MTTLLMDAFNKFPKARILVIGDIMLDQYTFGKVSRISPEAPVPIINKTNEKYVLGGAANVANNISSLGGKVTVIGVVGNDYRKDILFNLINTQKIKQRIIISKTRPTILKNRIMVSDFQQFLRFDDEVIEELSTTEENKVLKIIEKELSQNDILILSDYAKGFFSSKLTANIIKLARKYKKRIIADVKPQNKLLFKGIDLLKPNAKEAMEMTGAKDPIKSGEMLVKEFKSDVLVTLGGDGMVIFYKNGGKKHISSKKVKVFDVSGAGDTIVATLGLSLASDLGLQDAVDIANRAGGIVVQKPGTATLSLEELIADFSESNHIEEVSMVPKLWGYEKWLENNDKYCCKLLVLHKGYQCSLHYHKEKDEMFFVSKGYVRLETDGKVSYMKEGNFARIVPGTKHRFRGIQDSVIIEVSTHHEESDSYRIEASMKVKDE